MLYFDVFHHPLLEDELGALVGGPPTLDARTERVGRHVCRTGASADVEKRVERSRRAETLWPHAVRMGRLVARFPWVRGVFLTGSLSKRSAAEDADVDFLLLVEDGRVWSTKTVIELVRRASPDRVRESLCANYLRAVGSPALDDRTVFTAMELATAVPLHGPDACGTFLRANEWVRRWVPGFDFALARARVAAPLPGGPTRRWEGLVPAGVDAQALAAWDRFWNWRYRALDPATRAQRFKRRVDVSTNHFDDFQARVCAAYEARCVDAGVTP